MSRKVAIYVRVSTTNQAEEGYSIDGQLDSLTKYCEVMGWSVYQKYIDAGFSGGKLERPDILKLIKDAKRGVFDTVLVYKLDRLSRNVQDTLYLVKEVFNKNEVHFVSLQENLDTSSAMGNLFLTLLSAIAEFEREQIKERMQLGKIGRAKSGKSMMWAKVAYGYTYHVGTGEMTVNQSEAIAVREVFNSYLNGRSISKLRDDLNEEFPKTPAWSYRTIRQMLDNPVYCGYNKYKGVIYPGNHEAIISEDVYNKVQEEIKLRQIKTYAQNNNPRPFQSKYMLSGIGQCGYCKAPLKSLLRNTKKDGTRTVRYECHQRRPKKIRGVTTYNDNKKCNSGIYSKDDLEAYVLESISKLQTDSDYIDELFDTEPEKLDREAINKEIESLSNKVSKLNDLYINNLITLDDLKNQSSTFNAKIEKLKDELANDPAIKHQENKQKMLKILDTKDVLKMDYEEQKILVRALINKVQVTSDSIKILWKI
ncbi:recombinase family protein [Streptococcus gallolyticus]|uniref:recombinase family protein n=1 Tax=Streptococcus gallolyticus TaxID=315405 RepID=UPI001F18E328|nr:recombinase family protein [Streptococcus gallolyticus]MCF1634350.1 recombinase family protein [Streptococcus gallolyticus]